MTKNIQSTQAANNIYKKKHSYFIIDLEKEVLHINSCHIYLLCIFRLILDYIIVRSSLRIYQEYSKHTSIISSFSLCVHSGYCQKKLTVNSQMLVT